MYDTHAYATMQANGNLMFDQNVACGWCSQMFRFAVSLPPNGSSSATIRQERAEQTGIVTIRLMDMYTNTTLASQTHQCGVPVPVASPNDWMLSAIQSKVDSIGVQLSDYFGHDGEMKTLKSELRTSVSAREVLEDRLKWAEEDSLMWQNKADEAMRMLDGFARAIEAHHPQCPDCQGMLATWRKYAED